MLDTLRTSFLYEANKTPVKISDSQIMLEKTIQTYVTKDGLNLQREEIITEISRLKVLLETIEKLIQMFDKEV